MKSSGTSIIVIGIILGTILGYGGAFISYSPQIEKLSSQMQQTQGTLGSLEQQYDTLKNNYDRLLSNYNTLNRNHNELSIQHTELSTEYNQLENEYAQLLEDYEEIVASLPITQTPISAETIEMNYNWYYLGRRFTIALSVPESLYNYYKEKDRAHTEDYSIYVTHPSDDVYIDTIIKKFNFIALEYGYTEEQKINLVISFVQSLPYTVDSVTTPYDEYPRYPLETLVDNGGDCEDTSILTASLLKAMNYDVILIAPPQHLAVGVNINVYGSYWDYEDKRYFFLETTSEGWKIGQYPDELEKTAHLYALNPIAICTHNWVTSWKGSKLEVKITVTNEGTALADDISVYAAFDAGNDLVWSMTESDKFDLGIENTITKTLLLTPPNNKHTRLIVGICNAEGYSIDVSYSTWFDT